MTNAATPGTHDLTTQLRGLRDSLLTGLVERDVAVRLALIAALAGEHLLMVGPPGTAKSLIARRLHLAFKGGNYFERLLTRFTVPEELFGPLSIKGLEEDRYERLTQAYLPTASIAFLDEIFKANSAILNALLTLLNEREFDNGAHREPTPLISVIGASNELPESEELDALFDRFLLRLHVGAVSKAAFPTLLGLRGSPKPEVPDALQLTGDELKTIQDTAAGVQVPPDVLALICDLREWCQAQDVLVSDRRWRKVIKLLQVAAVTNGRAAVSIWDCWLLQHCLWETPGQREALHQWYSARVGASAVLNPERLTKIVSTWENRLKQDGKSRSQVMDVDGNPLFVGPGGKPVTSSTTTVQARNKAKDPLYLAPAHSHTDRHCYNSVHDRRNGGNGFALAELDALFMQHGHPFARWESRASYLADSNNWMMVDAEAAPYMEPTRHKPHHVAQCLAEVDRLGRDAADYATQVSAHRASLESTIREDLWVTADFVAPAALSLDRTAQAVEALQSRIRALRTGFELLPTESDEGNTNGETE